MHIAFNGDNLHEMSNLVFTIISLLSAELAQRVVMVKFSNGDNLHEMSDLVFTIINLLSAELAQRVVTVKFF